MYKPALEDIKQIVKSGQYDLIPLSTEMYSDMVTPIDVFKKLKKISKHCFILESANSVCEDAKTWGRYTFLGFNPSLEITCNNGIMTLTSQLPGKENKLFKTDNPNKYLQEILNQNKSVKLDYLPSFTGGLVGYFAYDYVKYSEPLLNLDKSPDTAEEDQFNDVDLMLFDKVIAFDHYRQKIILIVNIKTDNLKTEYENGIKQLEELKKIINNGEHEQMPIANLKSDFKALFTEDGYCQMVNRAKDYINNGEISQIVLSNRYEADFEGSIFDTFRVLRTINPSPYMFYFSGANQEIAGASPETLVKLFNGKLSTFPLGGTRRRGATSEEDTALEKELLADKKELSEHDMLVDIGKEDLGKVSKPGTVKVEKYKTVLKFSHVMHIGSTVIGEIREDKTGLDVINAILPAGTLSGAPKKRAMQIINEQEVFTSTDGEVSKVQCKRGIYGGAIGYLDFTGNMDTCIAIRMVYRKNNKVFVRSGAGIVAESKPESEYQECVNKSTAVMNALRLSNGGLDK
ncbi:MAG: anthranilate synthase component I family protein [Treponema sp.]|nr:anthranilate synthase component I family protein [Treponema sp.]